MKKSLLYLTKKMHNGMTAVVIADRGCNDIDIKFEDGTVVNNVRRDAFNNGYIKNPNYNPKSHLGEIKEMNNGMKARIIAYRNYMDIDVEFEDGTIATNKRMAYFKKGIIANKSIGKMHAKHRNASIVGQTNLMNNGLKATVIADRGINDVDIMFEDGTCALSRNRKSFNNGSARPDKKNILGETNIMNNGMKATVIAVRTKKDIDVEFEDGTVVYNKDAYSFKMGNIGNPNIYYLSRPQSIVAYYVKKYFPDTIVNYRPDWLKNQNTGKNMEIDIWIPSLQIGIEYDGCILGHRQETYLSTLKYNLIVSCDEIKTIYTILERGTMEHFSNKHKNIVLSSNSKDPKKVFIPELERSIVELLKLLGINDKPKMDYNYKLLKHNGILGETRIMNNGLKATVIADRGAYGVDVQFENGEISLNKSRGSFKKGNIALSTWHSILGETNIMNNGLKATVIADRGTNDIDVQFENGTIAEHKTRHRFREGKIDIKHDFSILNVTKIMNGGMSATVISDRGSQDIDVQFEDGVIVKNRERRDFLKGSIRHPKIYNRTGEKKQMNNGMQATIIADRGSKDIDIKFEDGTIVKHTRRELFDKGCIKNPNKKISYSYKKCSFK